MATTAVASPQVAIAMGSLGSSGATSPTSPTSTQPQTRSNWCGRVVCDWRSGVMGIACVVDIVVIAMSAINQDYVTTGLSAAAGVGLCLGGYWTQRLAALGPLHAAADELVSTSRELTTTKEQLKAKIEEFAKVQQELQQAKADMDARVQELTAARGELEKTAGSLKDTEKALATLSEKEAALNKDLQAQAGTLQKTEAELRKTVEDKEALVRDHANAVAQLTETNSALKVQVGELKEQIAKMQPLMDKFKGFVQGYVEQNDLFRQTQEQLEHTTGRLTEDQEHLLAGIKEREEFIGKTDQIFDEDMDQFAKLIDNAIAVSQGMTAEFARQNQTLQAQIDLLTQTVTKWEGAGQAAADQTKVLAGLQEQTKATEDRLLALKRELEEMQTALKTAASANEERSDSLERAAADTSRAADRLGAESRNLGTLLESPLLNRVFERADRLAKGPPKPVEEEDL